MNRMILTIVLGTLLLQGAILVRSTSAWSALAGNEAQPPSIDISEAPIKGNPQATLVLVEFSDYECPFCGRYTNETEPQIEKTFVATGKLRYAFMNNPLPFHPSARLLASAAICAGKQNRYWEMHDHLFEKRPGARAELMAALDGIPLDTALFSACLDDSSQAPAVIDRDLTRAEALKLNGTPSFALGRVDSGNSLIVEKIIVGAQPYSVFEQTIHEELENQRPRTIGGWIRFAVDRK
jgi:protein-disulfide isomerase